MSNLEQIKKSIQKITQSTYYRNAFTLISGSAIAQAVILLMTPILTRLFSTEDFGLYTAFLAVVGMLGILASLRYELAILLPKKEEDAFHIFGLATLTTLLFSAILWFILPWLNSPDWLLDKLNIAQPSVLFLVPLGIILYNTTKASSYIANRIKAYKWLSLSRVLGGISTGLISLLLGWQGFTVLGLIFAKTIGWTIEFGVALFPAKEKFKAFAPTFKFTNFKTLAIKYQNFPKYSTPEGFLNVGFKQIPILLLTAWFSLEMAGTFGMAFMLLSRPLGMISGAFGQIFFQKAASLEGKDKKIVQKLFRDNLRFLIILAFFPCLIIAIFAPQLFPFILGEGWEMTGIFVRWLMPFSFITFLKGPFSAMVDIKNKIGINVFFEIAFFVFSLFAFYLGYYFEDVVLAVKVFSFSCTVIGLWQLYWFYSLTKLKEGW